MTTCELSGQIPNDDPCKELLLLVQLLTDARRLKDEAEALAAEADSDYKKIPPKRGRLKYERGWLCQIFKP